MIFQIWRIEDFWVYALEFPFHQSLCLSLCTVAPLIRDLFLTLLVSLCTCFLFWCHTILSWMREFERVSNSHDCARTVMTLRNESNHSLLFCVGVTFVLFLITDTMRFQWSAFLGHRKYFVASFLSSVFVNGKVSRSSRTPKEIYDCKITALIFAGCEAIWKVTL